MAFVLYEIWTENTDGQQSLYDTTGSFSEAIQSAKEAIEGKELQAVIYQDDGNDDVFEVKRIKNS